MYSASKWRLAGHIADHTKVAVEHAGGGGEQQVPPTAGVPALLLATLLPIAQLRGAPRRGCCGVQLGLQLRLWRGHTLL